MINYDHTTKGTQPLTTKGLEKFSHWSKRPLTSRSTTTSLEKEAVSTAHGDGGGSFQKQLHTEITHSKPHLMRVIMITNKWCTCTCCLELHSFKQLASTQVDDDL